MSYESTLKRLPNFLRYVNKVYGFSQTIESMQGNGLEDMDVKMLQRELSVVPRKLRRNKSLWKCRTSPHYRRIPNSSSRWHRTLP